MDLSVGVVGAVSCKTVDMLGSLEAARGESPEEPLEQPHLSDAILRRIHTEMLRARMLDQHLLSLQRQGRIGFHIGCSGEEATIIGSICGMNDDDWVFPSYREFAIALWRGMSLEQLLDHMRGNRDDFSRGRQMPSHFTFRGGRMVSISSPVGTQIPQAVGFSWAASYRGDKSVTIVYFGEGTTSSGEFHSGLNFAGVLKTATIFLCRNNGWAISMPAERQTASETFAEKGAAYGIPSIRCDGNDVLAVISATRAARARAARGEGSTLIEAVTFRLGGHSSSDDPTRYRDGSELARWQQLDPLLRMERYLRSRSLWNERDQRELEASIARELTRATAAAERTGPPATESLFDDVYAELPWHLVEQREELLSLIALGQEGHAQP